MQGFARLPAIPGNRAHRGKHSSGTAQQHQEVRSQRDGAEREEEGEFPGKFLWGGHGGVLSGGWIGNERCCVSRLRVYFTNSVPLFVIFE